MNLKAYEVLIIGHHDCGMSAIDSNNVIETMKKRGIDQNTIDTLTYSGIDLHNWLEGFNSVEESVQHSVDMVKNHPLMAKDIPVHGLVIHPETGKLDLIINGYESLS